MLDVIPMRQLIVNINQYLQAIYNNFATHRTKALAKRKVHSHLKVQRLMEWHSTSCSRLAFWSLLKCGNSRNKGFALFLSPREPEVRISGMRLVAEFVKQVLDTLVLPNARILEDVALIWAWLDVCSFCLHICYTITCYVVNLPEEPDASNLLYHACYHD